MFLVEVGSGQRNHYSSARALGAAIRRGELGPQARIFHQASSQWLPITVHPEYRRAESEWEEGVATRWRARGWTFFSDRSDAGHAHAAAPAAPPEPGARPAQVAGHGQGSRLRSAVRQLLHRTRSEA